tara:strand:- start:2412 stop:3155 length:744 start_codon:yes stop_codon:yes gene_type:complete
MKVAIVGYGHVGKATELLLKELGTKVVRHDPPQGIVLEEWDDVQYAFICVPTPTTESGKLDVSIVKEAVDAVPEHVHTIIRCTMGPDQVEEFNKHQVSFWPEFIRENHVMTDLGSIDVPSMVGSLTLQSHEFVGLLRDYGLNTTVVQPKEAMMVKVMINTFLAMKIGFANDMWVIAKAHDLKPSRVFELAQLDKRMGDYGWQVPGEDGKFGFGGACLPKDSKHMLTLRPPSKLLQSIQDYDHSKQKL